MRATLIANPLAGKGVIRGQLTEAVNVLEQAGWEVTICESLAPGDATRIAREAVAQGHEAVLVAGGDGTINEAIQALAGSQVALGYLPYGTVNVWARETGTPLDPIAASRAIVEGRTEPIDLGLANDRYFLLMAGIGFDGEVVRRARAVERHKQRFGILPYVAVGLTAATRYRGADLELRYDGIIRRVQALMLVVGNTRLYGGRFYLTPNAVANDGWLDLGIVKGKGPLALARQSIPLLLLGSTAYSDVEYVRVRELTVQSNEPIPLQLDGELVGETPARIRVAPRALQVIVPRHFASDLIA
ncbi:MAG TPA: diacylglycerol kinase family protein [Chloroflexota bacterium]